MHLRRLTLQNVKCFESLDLSFGDGDSYRRWTFIVGVNGTGKTTILKSCATALSSSWQGDSGLGVPPPDSHWVRNGRESWSLRFEAHFEDQEGKSVPAEDAIEVWPGGRSSSTGGASNRRGNRAGNLMVALGAVRSLSVPAPRPGLPERADEPSWRRARLGSAKALFSPQPDQLAELYSWIRWEDFIGLKQAVDQSHRPSVMGALRGAFDRMFEGMASFQGVDTRGSILFDTEDGPVPIDAMADGARSLFVIVAELLLRLDAAFPDSRNPTREEAVCIIDELDAHLHPRLQRTVVPALRDLFPNVQFIVTTHSPYVVGAARPDEIIALRREPGGVVRVPRDEIPDVAGWTADAIATSPIFGLDTTRDVRGERALRTEQELLGRGSVLSSGEKQRLGAAQKLLKAADGPMTQLVRAALGEGLASPPKRSRPSAGRKNGSSKQRATKRR
jgi:hypothetical protein